MITNKKLFKKSRKSIFVKKLKRQSTLSWVCDDSRYERRIKVIYFEKFSKYSFSNSIIARLTCLRRKLTCSKTFFFSKSFSIDLINISRFFYLNLIECFSSIIEKKVLTIIKRFVFNKTSSFDDFINKIFKTCVFIMIKLFIFLFKTCI